MFQSVNSVSLESPFSSIASYNQSAVYTSGVSNAAGIWLADIGYIDTYNSKTKVQKCVSLLWAPIVLHL